MKTTLILICLLFFACKPSRQQKAETLARKYLFRILTFPENYQPLTYSKLDSFLPGYSETKFYDTLNLRREFLGYEYGRYNSRLKKFGGLDTQTRNDLHSQLLQTVKRIDSLKEHYKPSLGGWKMTHSFRGREGNSIIDVSWVFTFDRNVDSIIEVENAEQ